MGSVRGFLVVQAFKVAWKGAVKRMPALRTWGPIIGGLVVLAVAVLQVFGQHDAASLLLTLAAAVGLTQQSPVGVDESKQLVTLVVGASLFLWGVGRKFAARVREIRASREHVAPRP